MKTNTKNPQGIVAIVSMLVVASIATLFAINMLKDSLGSASLSSNSVSYEIARMNSVTCLEDTLIRIKQASTFNQDLNYTLTENDACSTNIIWYGEAPISTGIREELATLDVTGESGNFSRTFRYELRVTKFDVNYNDGTLDYMNDIAFTSIEEI